MNLRILHVTESMGGGVVTLLDSITRRQCAEGADVDVVYSVRPDTPSLETLRERFLPDVNLRRIGGSRRSRGLRPMFKQLREHYRRGDFDVVHLHSSFAGAIGRCALIGAKSETKVFYSPHGLAFLRLNVSPIERFLTLRAEKLLGKKGDGVICTAQSELDLVQERLGIHSVAVLQTGVPSETVAAKPRLADSQRLPVVGMVGRATFQKAPWRFAAVARALEGQATFLWIGASGKGEEEAWFRDSQVDLIPWLSPGELDEYMETIDILLFPSLWEGMPLSLIQAQSAGIPAVVSDCVGNRDAVLHGQTGFVCESDQELIEYTRMLIMDPALREEMSLAALTWAREHLVDDRIGRDSIMLYNTVLQSW